MRIGFLGDTASPNSQSWIGAMKAVDGTEVISWSLTHHRERSRAQLAPLVREIATLKRWVARHRPDVLIGYRISSYGFLGAMTGFRPLVLAAQGAHGDVWPGGRFTWVKRRCARYAVRHADLVHAWSESMTPAILRLGAERDRLLVMPRGIDLERFHRSQAEDCTPVPMIVTRSLLPEYHVEVILDAVAAVVGQGFDVELTLVGDGPCRTALEQQAETLGIADRVRFLGRIPNDRVAAELSRSWLYLSMPETEGASASLFEAMASGLYPIVSDLPGNRVWIDPGVNGSLIPVGDAEALSAAMVEALGRGPALRPVLEANARLVEEQASLSRNVRRFVETYRSLVAEKEAS